MSTSQPPFDDAKIRVVSLFCGMGNADAGLYDAADELGVSIEIVAAYDSWDKAVAVYNANLHPVAQVADVKQITAIPECDLVIGGPPCQPFSRAGKQLGHEDERNCIPDFLRLANGKAWIMENVAHLLIQAPWSEKLCSADFGDVTLRRRWFYSNYLLHVMPEPSPRRFRDIRSTEGIPGRRRFHGKIVPIGDDDFLPTLTAHFWHGFDVRSAARLVDGYRCPSIEEGQRSHSIPDSWTWANANKSDRAKMIANSWTRRLAKAVCKAMLTALIAERELAA